MILTFFFPNHPLHAGLQSPASSPRFGPQTPSNTEQPPPSAIRRPPPAICWRWRTPACLEKMAGRRTHLLGRCGGLIIVHSPWWGRRSPPRWCPWLSPRCCPRTLTVPLAMAALHLKLDTWIPVCSPCTEWDIQMIHIQYKRPVFETSIFYFIISNLQGISFLSITDT
jgi:hypothetical protein